MTLCVFALIASEFMPVSLLTPMAQTLRVTEGMAGQGIAISGAFAVVTSLFISVLAGTLNRKTLLLGLTCIMAISGAFIAMAPNYLTYMAGRALIGIVVGGFWSMSAATAMRLVPVHRVPLALAIFNSGNALATVVAAPLGSWLGSVVGWRGAFFCLVPVAIIAFVWQLLSLPSMSVTRQAAASRNVFMLFRRRVVTLGMLGAPATPHGSPEVFSLIMKRRSIAGSMIGGIPETQEMLDFCAQHGIVADIELIRADQINDAYERMLRGDVHYRFVIDNATLA
ncbi:TPA: MFS transporter [Citrobacter freundii]|uniref:MFS transporter n=1 Tax=Citrobacter freundii TaxID=546 RepID=UPI0024E0F683|nr:MFS transporter [Citrobacter freundii]WOR57584.1 MFS transporter [Citrobacter freundii]